MTDAIPTQAADPLAALTVDHFLPCLGQNFMLAAVAPHLGLRLVSAQASRHLPASGRRGFALMFAGQVSLPQTIHKLQHPELGTLDIFLVPIGPGEKGLQYEAIFN